MSTALEMAQQQITDYEEWAKSAASPTPMPGRIREWSHVESRYAYYADLMLARWIVEQSKANDERD